MEIDHPPAAGEHRMLPAAIVLLAAVSAALIIRFRWFRLRRAPRRPEVVDPAVGMVLFLAMFLVAPATAHLLRPWLGIAVDADDVTTLDLTLAETTRLSLAVYAGQAIVGLVYLSRIIRARRRAAGTRPGPGRAALVGVAAIALWWPIVAASAWVAGILMTIWWGTPPPRIAHDTLRLFLERPWDGWLVTLTALVVVAAPLFEELLYRGLLQELLRRAGLAAWPAIGVTSVLFAAMHWQNTAPHAVVALFILSLAFGWAYERTGRLTAPIVMHAVFNVGNVVLALASG